MIVGVGVGGAIFDFFGGGGSRLCTLVGAGDGSCIRLGGCD